MELLRATGDDGDLPGWKRGVTKGGGRGVAERESLDTGNIVRRRPHGVLHG